MNKKLKTNDLINIIVLIFTIGCIIGTYYEQIYTLIKHLIKYGSIIWVSRRGLIYGPLSPIYGVGAVLIFLIFKSKRLSKLKVFIYGALLGGSYEFAASIFQEKLFGTMSWNYSKYFLNIAGRTTIPYMIFWGILVLVFVYYINPLILNFYNKINGRVGNIVIKIVLIFLIFDIIISVTAAGRRYMRFKGIEAKTFIGEFCDKYYPDEYLEKIYENAKFVK